MNKPQPQILHIWRLTLAIITLAPALLVSVLLRMGSAVWVVATVCWIILFLAAYLVYLPLLYKRMEFGIKSEKIVFATGVFYNRLVSMPLCAIQFTTVTQSVLDRIFGLSSVIVTAAGGRIIIPGLKAGDAKALAASLNTDIP